MKIPFKNWILFILIAILCLGLWYKFAYPRLIFLDLSVGKNEALEKAESYLFSCGVNPKEYLKAIVFENDIWADRYLQKTIGLEGEERFLRQHNYELFYWRIRFFKELHKEEFLIYISPKTGEVLGFNHFIEDVESREDLGKEAARQTAEELLKKIYGFNPKEYDFHKEELRRYDSRKDYSFSWEKKGVYILWGSDGGGAKLLINATISGKEGREFSLKLEIPEKFRRYIDNQFIFGEYLYSFSYLLFIILLAWSIYLVMKRKDTLAIRLSKKPFFYLAVFIALMNIGYILNNLQGIMMGYPTTANLVSFFWIYALRLILSTIFLSVNFIFPALAGESLREEEFPTSPYSSLSHYIKSTFYSRGVTKAVLLGYLLFFILLGIQATLFYFGQKYLGVWKEWVTFTQFSSSYFPFLSAFIIGSSVSVNEEIMFRLFGISWAKKYLKNTFLAVVFSSFIWGLGHSGYAVFPIWFRALEVTFLGLFLGFIFLRYGLLPLIVAHYLLDVYWGVVGYILGHSSPHLFVSSALILVIPLIFAGIAYFMNKEERAKEIKTVLNHVQKYNLDILVAFVSLKKSQGFSADIIKKELVSHNWDIVLVNLAIEEVFRLH